MSSHEIQAKKDKGNLCQTHTNVKMYFQKNSGLELKLKKIKEAFACILSQSSKIKMATEFDALLRVEG